MVTPTRAKRSPTRGGLIRRALVLAAGIIALTLPGVVIAAPVEPELSIEKVASADWYIPIRESGNVTLYRWYFVEAILEQPPGDDRVLTVLSGSGRCEIERTDTVSAGACTGIARRWRPNPDHLKLAQDLSSGYLSTRSALGRVTVSWTAETGPSPYVFDGEETAYSPSGELQWHRRYVGAGANRFAAARAVVFGRKLRPNQRLSDRPTTFLAAGPVIGVRLETPDVFEIHRTISFGPQPVEMLRA